MMEANAKQITLRNNVGKFANQIIVLVTSCANRPSLKLLNASHV